MISGGAVMDAFGSELCPWGECLLNFQNEGVDRDVPIIVVTVWRQVERGGGEDDICGGWSMRCPGDRRRLIASDTLSQVVVATPNPLEICNV